MNYDIIYSNRKTLAIYVKKDGKIEVRCNKATPKTVIENFITEKQDWIISKQVQLKSANIDRIQLTHKTLIELKNKAYNIIPKRVEYYSKKMDITPNSVKINTAKTRWGSCSNKNNLNFSCRLMLANDYVIDYVIIHELAHIKQHNHSKDFWDIVRKYCPEYKKYKQELKQLSLRLE